MGRSIFGQAEQPSAGQPNFVQFMHQMRGKDPQAMIRQIVQERGITQDQMNAIQKQAQAISGQFNQFRSMFGF